MTAENKRYCEDCVYHRDDGFLDKPESDGFFCDTCTHPAVETALVRAAQSALSTWVVRRPCIWDYNPNLYCNTARAINGPCGPEGRFYTPGTKARDLCNNHELASVQSLAAWRQRANKTV
jgi:hypothetical protein